MKNFKLFKSLLICIFVCLYFISCGGDTKTGYELSGTIGKNVVLDDSKSIIAELSDFDGKTIATVPVVNRKFCFKGNVEKPSKVILKIDELSIFTELILENYSYKTTIDKYNTYTKGGMIHKLVYGYTYKQKYLEAKKNFEIKAIDLKKKLDRIAERELKNDLNDKNSVVLSIKRSYQNGILNGDYPALTKFFVLSDNYDLKTYGLQKRLAMLEQYEKEIGSDAYLNKLRERLLKWKNRDSIMSKGKTFIKISEVSTDGKKVDLGKVVMKNKFTLLDFWASWCHPCRNEFPSLKEVYKKYHSEGFEIYAVSIDTEEENWIDALKEENVPWINVRVLNGIKSESAKKYAIRGIPTSFLIDKKGTIIATRNELLGYALEKKLKELLNKN